MHCCGPFHYLRRINPKILSIPRSKTVVVYMRLGRTFLLYEIRGGFKNLFTLHTNSQNFQLSQKIRRTSLICFNLKKKEVVFSLLSQNDSLRLNNFFIHFFCKHLYYDSTEFGIRSSEMAIKEAKNSTEYHT